MILQSGARYFIRGDTITIVGVFDDRLRYLEPEQKPYGFVRIDDVAKIDKREVEGIYEEDLREPPKRYGKVCRVEVNDPKKIPNIRSAVERKGGRCYEMDIPYIRRLLIDREYDVKYDECQAYIDIELDDSKGMPLDYGNDKIISIGMYYDKGDGEWFYIGDYDNEKQMLENFIATIENDVKTVFVGWNVGFDYKHIFERAKRMGINNRFLGLVQCVDLKAKYESAVKGLESYSLEEVSKHEGFEPKKRRGLVSDMSRRELEEYNMYDALLCRMIEDKYGFVELEFAIAEDVNLTLDMCLIIQKAVKRKGSRVHMLRSRSMG